MDILCLFVDKQLSTCAGFADPPRKYNIGQLSV